MPADTIVSHPVLSVALAAIIILLVHYQRGLAYREVIAIERLRQWVFPLLDARATAKGRPLLTERDPPREDADHIATLSAPPRAIVRDLRAGGFEPQLLSTVKYYVIDGQRTVAHSQWAFYHDDDQQTHVYLFVDGEETHVYAHVEPAVFLPDAHHGGEDQQAGDTRGVVADALARNA